MPYCLSCETLICLVVFLVILTAFINLASSGKEIPNDSLHLFCVSCDRTVSMIANMNGAFSPSSVVGLDVFISPPFRVSRRVCVCLSQHARKFRSSHLPGIPRRSKM